MKEAVLECEPVGSILLQSMEFITTWLCLAQGSSNGSFMRIKYTITACDTHYGGACISGFLKLKNQNITRIIIMNAS